MKKLLCMLFMLWVFVITWCSNNTSTVKYPGQWTWYDPVKRRCVTDSEWNAEYSEERNWFRTWWAQRWCTCDQIRKSEINARGFVDEDALKTDFWC